MDPAPANPAARHLRRARLFAVLTAACTVPLVLFGGSVTTLGAGMAVEGWLIAEGHFLPFFPVEEWFRDVPTIVEHTHRMFGMLVGLFSIATVVTAWRAGRVGLPLAGLVAVCAQGTLGGFRVLEDSPQLAFLHGALAQGVFAFLCAIAVALGRRDDSARPPRERPDAKLRRFAWAVALIVMAQIVLGAWYRHGLRTGLEEGLALRLALHFAGAFAVFLLVAALASRLESLATLTRDVTRLRLLLGVQLALGVFAWGVRTGGEVTVLEWGTSVLHVLFGGLLLAECAAVLVRLAPIPDEARMPASGAATAGGPA